MACLTPRKGTSEFRPVIPNAPKKAPQALGQFQKLTRQDIWLAATCKERLNKAAPQRKHMTSVLSDDDEDNLGSEEESGEEPLLMDCSRDRNNEPTELDPSPAKKQDEKTEEETEKQVKEIETRKQELDKALKQVQKENAKLQKAIELAEAEIKELEFISMEEPETETKQEAIQRRGVYTAGCFAAVHFMYPLGLLTKSHQGTIGFAKIIKRWPTGENAQTYHYHCIVYSLKQGGYELSRDCIRAKYHASRVHEVVEESSIVCFPILPGDKGIFSVSEKRRGTIGGTSRDAVCTDGLCSCTQILMTTICDHGTKEERCMSCTRAKSSAYLKQLREEREAKRRRL